MTDTRRLDWDSDFFGFTIVEAVTDRHDGCDLADAMAAGRDLGAGLLVYAAPAGAAVTLPGRATLVDTRHSYVCDYARIEFGLPDTGGLIESHGDPRPTPALDRLGILSGVHSRFFHDPHFPRAAAEALYVTWVRRALTREFGDHVYVARDGRGDIAAMYSGRIDAAGYGVPDLMAVEPHMRGHGLGKGFFMTSMLHFRDRGILKGRLKSQGRNAFARAIYEGLGWTLQSREDVYHVWLDTPPVKDRNL